MRKKQIYLYKEYQKNLKIFCEKHKQTKRYPIPIELLSYLYKSYKNFNITMLQNHVYVTKTPIHQMQNFNLLGHCWNSSEYFGALLPNKANICRGIIQIYPDENNFMHG